MFILLGSYGFINLYKIKSLSINEVEFSYSSKLNFFMGQHHRNQLINCGNTV